MRGWWLEMGSTLKVRVSKFGGLAIALALVLLVSGCPGFFIGSHDIATISITPNGPFIMPQGTQQFTATATYGNNSTGDVTSSVTWTSSVPAIATIDSAGLATGVALGTTSIKARSSNGVNSSVVLTVANHTVTMITVSPTSATINLSFGQPTQQFNATVTFSDGTMGNQVNWTSSNTGVVTINSSGLATGVSTGSATITASLGGQSATASVTVQ